MEEKKLLVAGGIILVIVGLGLAYLAGAFDRLLYKSKVEQRSEREWKVWLDRSDGWFDTGIVIKNSGVRPSIQDGLIIVRVGDQITMVQPGNMDVFIRTPGRLEMRVSEDSRIPRVEVMVQQWGP